MVESSYKCITTAMYIPESVTGDMKIILHLINVSSIAETLVILLSVMCYANSEAIMETEATLDCHRRPYSHKVSQIDSQGRICWDTITVMSCWGRCDSNEISDWRFPYKRSFHPVCIHGEREPKLVILSKCEEGAEPGTEIHEYMEALTCTCALCKSSEANCQGLRYVGQRMEIGFQRG